jgi:GTP-binding protein
MEIRTADFLASVADVRQCPASEMMEFAFIGRSNVGKSSLINCLTGRNGLAKTSSKPGKTLTINHFVINNQWQLVDLPGYGYARAGRSQREALRRMIDGYALYRQQMACLFVLIDSRHPAQKIDLEFMQWLGENEVPFAIIFTKADKQSRTRTLVNVEAYKAVLLESWESLPDIFITSSESGAGRDEVLGFIEGVMKGEDPL